MKKSLYLPILFTSFALLTACGNKEGKEQDNAKTAISALTPRTVDVATTKVIKEAYLRNVLPESAYAYARIPNLWSFIGGATNNIFDKALNSKPYEENLAAIKAGFEENIIPDLKSQARAGAELFLARTTSPIELAAISLAGAAENKEEQKNSPVNILLTVGVDFKDITSFNNFLKNLLENAPDIRIKKALQADGTGELSVKGLNAQIKLDVATQRLFILGGIKLQENSLETTLKQLNSKTTHRMKTLEGKIDDSGQGLFAWADTKKLLALANTMGAQKALGPLAILGINSMRNIALGIGTSNGINHLKFILDMPKTGFRGYIPTIQDAPNFTMSSDTDFVITLGLPTKADFVTLETTVAAMAKPKDTEKYFEFKKTYAKVAGIEIEDLFAIFGQDYSIVSDSSGTYLAQRLKDAEKFNAVINDVVKRYKLKYEIRTIAGQEYHHLEVPSLVDIADLPSNTQKDFTKNPILKRILSIPEHVYWQQEGDYLISATLPQVLMDRHYDKQQIKASEWFEKQQRTDPKGALFMASIQNKHIPAAMYRAKLGVLSYLGDAVGKPVDMFSLPSAQEANLPKKGSFGLKLSSTEEQFALDLSFESNPAEILFAGNAYAGLMVTGILASIAVPAYQDYSLRAKVSMGFSAANLVKDRVNSFKLENNRYPTEEEVSAFDQTNWKTKDFKVTIEPDNGNIIVEYNHPRLYDNLILLKPEEGETTWECVSDLRKSVLPLKCK